MLSRVAISVAMAGSIVSPFMPLATAPHSDLVAAVFPPWLASATIMERAGQVGAIAGLSRLPFVVFVQSDLPDVSDRLRTQGAIATFDSSFLAICRI
jgi:hypothetical protein